LIKASASLPDVAVSQVISNYSDASPISTATESFFPHPSVVIESATVKVLPLPGPPIPPELPDQRLRWPSIQPALTLIPLSALASLILMAIGAPVGWLLGAMLIGIGYVIKHGKTQVLFPGAAAIGQVIIALATADRFSLDTLTLARTYALPLMLCILTTGSLSVLNGYLLSRWVGIDRKTSLLGCIPGAGPSIVALSEEMGADTLIVAVLQYVRILLVSAVIPILANLFFVSSASLPSQAIITAVHPSTISAVINLLVLAGCGYLGNWAGRQLRLPSGGFLGPFLVGLIAFWGVPHTFYMPQTVFIAGLLLVGLSIGLKFDWHTVRRLFKAVLIEIVLVLGLIFTCLGVAYGFHLITHIDPLTAVLGSTPGGISTMLASAVEMGTDSGLVMAMQMTRMLLILLLTPWLATIWIKPKPSDLLADPPAPG